MSWHSLQLAIAGYIFAPLIPYIILSIIVLVALPFYAVSTFFEENKYGKFIKERWREIVLVFMSCYLFLSLVALIFA